MPKVAGFRTNKDTGHVFPLFSGQTKLGDFNAVQAQDNNRSRIQDIADNVGTRYGEAKKKEFLDNAAKIDADKKAIIQRRIARGRGMLAESELKQEAQEIRRQTGLVKPEIVNTGSIPEAIIAPAPTGFKKYSENARSFEVSEEDFVQRYIEKDKARLEGNLKYWEKQLTELGPKATSKRHSAEQAIEITKRQLQGMAENDPSKVKWLEHDAKKNYNELVRFAIKKGEPVPDAVIAQKPEFQVAKTARIRYEKGLHTSFANKSAAVNAVMFLEKGYKVKRQDGKEIMPNQITEIDTGIGEIQTAVGPIKDIMEKSDLTIAHTSGKFPFLDGSAGGVFHPTENTITTGVEVNFFGKVLPMRSLAHEWAHWLDHVAGLENKSGYELYSNGRTQRKIKSYKEALSHAEQYKNPLYRQAEDKMNNDYEIRKLFRPSLSWKDQTKEEAEIAKVVRAQIGGYYRDPREIWARLTEQYVADIHGKETIASHKPEYYEKHPAYWNKANFEELKPMVKAELERRIIIARGQ